MLFDARKKLDGGKKGEGLALLESAYAQYPDAPVLAERKKEILGYLNLVRVDYAEELAAQGRVDEAKLLLHRAVSQKP